jgi:3-oxoacyl-[acyl-carrier-protein] synthase II
MSNTTKRRVVITGMGAITPLGNTLETLWDNVVQGKSGIGYLTCIPAEEQTCKIGGECWDFKAEDYMDKREARRMDRYTQFAMAASKLAYESAGLTEGAVDPARFGVVVSSASGGIGTIETQMRMCLDKGFNKCSPFLVPMMISDIAAGRVSIEYNAKGPNRAVVTACATGADSLGDAFRIIQNNEADVMIAGGAEAPMTSLSIAGFASARALSMRDDDPTKASRPFDKDRDGFVMSEGAGILVLEELNHALARGAKIYGEIIGYGRSADANDIVAPCADGDGARRAMEAAIHDAGISPDQVDYVNAHGTSTPLGDIAESVAVERVFGEHARSGKLKISSTKSMHGHLLGAAGSLEAIISVLALQNKVLPPTINIDHLDEQCPDGFDYVPNKARPVDKLDVAISNSFGFGGHNASLLFAAYPSNN